jgi:D-serine deaminase-like pyridoxal phosphate-dependent protein
MEEWFQIRNVEEIASPALLIYGERAEENIRRMIEMAGGAERLRPHVKTHKLGELVERQLELGIEKFKCATIAEAEMVGRSAAGQGRPCEVLLAYQPLGPNQQRLCRLIKTFPQTQFSVTVDDEGVARGMAVEAQRQGVKVEVLLDIDCGQHRTGIEANERAFELYRLITGLPGLMAGGLHAYDGHIHERDRKERALACEKAFAPVARMRERLLKAGLAVPRMVAGGTPTFPFHGARAEVECSPGTCVLWDWGYSTNFPDLDFVHAATLLTRIVSKPAANRLCLDLGHKAVASEMPHPRVYFPQLPNARAVAHNEEHLVIETDGPAVFEIGDAFYGIPWHICPTVALHADAIAVKNGRGEERWSIAARARRLTI